ncbi:MAG: glycosyltransferase family 2 protein [Thermodesulfobacteriota bacterium]|nr:glycosyltransferase family 2 protein [Thermodesulfobacteriota bacterium]
MKLSVVIPVYNEKNTISRIIEKVKETPIEKEIIVVDDASTDGTEKILRQIKGITFLSHKNNRGKGASFRTGLEKVTGDVVIIQDSDLEYDPMDYMKILKPFEAGLADVVYGSRFLGAGAHRVLFFWHSIGNRLLTFVSNMFTDLNLTDMETGYKAFRKEVIKKINIKENRFGFEPEITAKVARQKLRIYEVPISYHGRTYEEGKKINWKDGIVALWLIIKYNLFDRNNDEKQL